MQISELVEKIKSLPTSKKKIIFWTIVTITAILVLFWWVKDTSQRLKSFRSEEFIEKLKLPSFEEELKSIPKLEIEESLKELEEIMKEAEQSSGMTND